MTHIVDSAEYFAETALLGFCDAHAELVRSVRGGVLRAAMAQRGKVSVVIGGGSGHYPAFAGYVGRGFADAAVIGDVFASPSTRLIVDIARMSDHGGGVLLGFGNYAGDVLNFGFAAEQLRAEGIDVRVLPVSDDVASAPIERLSERRGVCGDLLVFKCAGAAADRGEDLDTVERLARHANARTQSFGIAFNGCTLPGATRPLFSVSEGMMAMGLGIHGEPGTEEMPIAPAAEIARQLFERIIVGRPADTTCRAVVVLNGLGGTKYEELFVLWHHLSRLFARHDVEIVQPLIGEFITSLDMEGCSLTVTWLDDMLEPLWDAPCETPVLRRGTLPSSVRAPEIIVSEADRNVWPDASSTSQALGSDIVGGLEAVAALMAESEHELGCIDAIAGDGDHGQGMARGAAAGAKAARDAANAGAGARSVLMAAGQAWADRAGGTSGALWGLGLVSAAQVLSDRRGGDARMAGDAAEAALKNIMKLGRARPGDKTLVDVLGPFAEVLTASSKEGQSFLSAWHAAAQAAEMAASDTAKLLPRVGRARPLAERSRGHRDAGAVSLALCAQAVLQFSEMRCLA